MGTVDRGRFQRHPCAGHKPIAAATFLQKARADGCRTRTSPESLPGPPDSIDRPGSQPSVIGAVSVSASAVGRQGMARAAHPCWWLVPGGSNSNLSPPFRSTGQIDPLRRRARHLQPPSPRRLPRGRDATRGKQRVHSKARGGHFRGAARVIVL